MRLPNGRIDVLEGENLSLPCVFCRLLYKVPLLKSALRSVEPGSPVHMDRQASSKMQQRSWGAASARHP